MNARLANPDGYPVVIFLDELFARMHATRRKMWAPRGLYPRLPSWDHHGKWAVFGGVELRSGQLFWHLGRKWNKEAFVYFLNQVVAQYPGQPVLLVWDRAGIHQSKLVQAWLAAHPEVQVYVLPAYCADLDPMEEVWNRLRREATDNHVFRQLGELYCAVVTWFEKWAVSPTALLQSIGIDPAAPRIHLQHQGAATVGPSGLIFIRA